MASLQVLREVVVAQLVERSLMIPEVCGSTPVIGKNLLNIYLLSNKKRLGMAHIFFKKIQGLRGDSIYDTAK